MAFNLPIVVVTVGVTKLDPFTATDLKDQFMNASTLDVATFLFIPEIIALALGTKVHWLSDDRLQEETVGLGHPRSIVVASTSYLLTLKRHWRNCLPVASFEVGFMLTARKCVS